MALFVLCERTRALELMAPWAARQGECTYRRRAGHLRTLKVAHFVLSGFSTVKKSSEGNSPKGNRKRT